jgi:hypothetical protein
MTKIHIDNRQEFISFLDSFASVSESFIIDVTKEKMAVTCASPDNTLISYGEYVANVEYEGVLCIPNGKRLVSLLSSIQAIDLDLMIHTNAIEYKGSGINFKYHLVDEDWIKAPALKPEKIKAFQYDTSYDINSDTIREIIKSSSFAPDTDNLYLFTEKSEFKCELTDRSKDNTDSYVMTIGEVSEPLSIAFSLRMDALRLLNLRSLQEDVKINFNTDLVVISLTGGTENSSITYILTTYGT